MLYWPGEEGDRRATMNFPPVDAELGYDSVDKLSEIARARGATVTQTALAWTLSRPFITSVIVGASRVSQLGDNLGAVDLELTSEELRDLDELTAPAPPYPNRMIERFPDVPVEKALWGG
jgi:aryl-alcohol dehydrogenase-like predicted oxidoreductase